MEDNTGFTSPDDDGADDALAAAEQIIDDASGAQDDFDADEEGADDALTQAEVKAAEHLADLQRLQAEYVNYRKRVDRDRAAIADVATSKVLEAMLPVLDDISAARQHGDLAEGPFASIAEKLEEALGRFGWSTFGEQGDIFDPALHEALMSQPSADVTEPTVHHVAQPGHRLGDRVVRAARVIVAQPEEDH
ncbi:nucleotide exchange factor GrpE [Demequina sp.]|uniref:nucleotide exchange factor GrpE n=1 Tax=Demequina sp. TaxID=2050685 RepID=UPI0025BAE735|nr:nucleotide exchange factor GrpE [Demequina sp.]